MGWQWDFHVAMSCSLQMNPSSPSRLDQSPADISELCFLKVSRRPFYLGHWCNQCLVNHLEFMPINWLVITCYNQFTPSYAPQGSQEATLPTEQPRCPSSFGFLGPRGVVQWWRCSGVLPPPRGGNQAWPSVHAGLHRLHCAGRLRRTIKLTHVHTSSRSFGMILQYSLADRCVDGNTRNNQWEHIGDAAAYF